MNYQDEFIYGDQQFSVSALIIYTVSRVSDALFKILATQAFYIVKENFGMQKI